ncbi:hypothetical protein W822_04800 [Advenella kashmirensis W13003]|uniref:Hydratase n=1 Tax=Advenella kashmirensis W13003 TaxID=1424334 RepID=V8QXV5_9BURK|nr:hypothetical protein [Advenella kashmirensis]ETF04741.1 hypothetical protein W822_04800 [Advenella kashmirensis W13003]
MLAEQHSLIKALTDARSDNRQIMEYDPDWVLETEDDGIKVMFAVAENLKWPQLGWKIAATNVRLQQKLRTEGPVFGATFERYLLHSPGDVVYENLLDPVIECEFAIQMGDDLPAKNGEYTFDDVARCVESVHICMEIAECRFPRKRLPSVYHIMADGFASGRYVLGNAVPDWQAALHKGIKVNLYKSGQLHSSGQSCDVMGHPLNPVVWLANKLRKYGNSLRAGHLVSSGSCNILCKASQGDVFEAVYENVGSVRLHIC